MSNVLPANLHYAEGVTSTKASLQVCELQDCQHPEDNILG